MLVVISAQMLARVDDEEEAHRLAIEVEKANLLGMEAAIERAGLDVGQREELEDNVAWLGAQVTVLPERVTA